MEWLSQNWFWLALAAAVVFMLSRGRQGAMGGGCCGGHMAHEGPAGGEKARGTDDAQTPAKAASAGTAASQGHGAQQHGRGGCH